MIDSDKSQPSLFPREPIHAVTGPLNHFLHVEAASGIVLLLCAMTALILANSPAAESYLGFWKTYVGFTWGEYELKHSLKHWINDALMAVFFFVIGLEVKREIVLGELRTFRRAALPVAAALGGMLIPAGIYLAMQLHQPGQTGWGVPMATDIAFVVGALAVLGRRIPSSLRVILLSIAIVDDIGAILVIAFGYTETVHTNWLIAGIVGIALVFIMQRVGVRSIGMYTLIGAGIWVAFHESGIHATIAGVALGLLTPARPYLANGVGGKFLERASDMLHGTQWETMDHRAEHIRQYQWATRETISPLEYLIFVLHPWVAFFIMPVFALANAGIPFEVADVISPVGMAVIVGLVLGKPLGIVLASWLSLKTRLAVFPEGMTWRHLLGGGFLAGVGFTMALFISGLAFTDAGLLRSAKVGVVFGSFAAAVVGMVILGTGRSEPEPPAAVE